MFGSLKKAFGAGAKEIKAEYSENKDFLEAVLAASALVAAADGDIEEQERRKVISVVSNHATLSKLYASNVIESTADTMFKRTVTGPGCDAMIGQPDGHVRADLEAPRSLSLGAFFMSAPLRNVIIMILWAGAFLPRTKQSRVEHGH